MTKQTVDDFKASKKAEAEKRIKLRFGVQEVFKLEEIEVSESELDKALEDELKIMASFQMNPETMDQKQIRLQVQNRLQLEKLIAKFIKK